MQRARTKARARARARARAVQEGLRAAVKMKMKMKTQRLWNKRPLALPRRIPGNNTRNNQSCGLGYTQELQPPWSDCQLQRLRTPSLDYGTCQQGTVERWMMRLQKQKAVAWAGARMGRAIVGRQEKEKERG